MNSFLQSGATFAAKYLRLLWDAVRRHPVRAVLVLPAMLLLYLLALYPFTPGIGELKKAKSEAPSRVLSSDGVVLAQYNRVNSEWVPLEKISPHVVNALIAVEDRRFFQHFGIDVRRTVAALLSTVAGDLQGGSTITQQLARNLYPEQIGRSISIHRKAKELITALKIEAAYSKREILETYLNTVPFLYNAFGIEMAARTYFDKSAEKLNVLEAATLIGMLKGTSAYNPVQNPERARNRRNLVLTQMVKHGKLGAEQLEALARQPLGLEFERQVEPLGLAPHVAQQLRRWLIDWADRFDFDIHTDGLVVRTTLDSKLQKAANQAVVKQVAQLQKLADGRRKRGVAQPALQGGFMAVDPRNGMVRAWVGSHDFAQEQFDHVNQARRQAGSTFKPFVYGAALIQGLGWDTTFNDERMEIRVPDGGVWSPGDVTEPTGLPMTMHDGLVHSKNTITAQVMQKVGPAAVAQLAYDMGVRLSKLDVVPSLALGTSPVTLREMVAAYGSIANGGNYIEPLIVLRVENSRGEVLQAFEPIRDPKPAMARGLTLSLVNALRGVVDEGTGAAIRSRYGITADVAGKTGTTQENSDGWFIMMHPELVAGAWVGYNDNSVTMGSWGQGARSALPIVGDVFQQALRQRLIDAKAEFDIPRSRPRPPEAARERQDDPVQRLIDRVRNIFRGL